MRPMCCPLAGPLTAECSVQQAWVSVGDIAVGISYRSHGTLSVSWRPLPAVHHKPHDRLGIFSSGMASGYVGVVDLHQRIRSVWQGNDGIGKLIGNVNRNRPWFLVHPCQLSFGTSIALVDPAAPVTSTASGGCINRLRERKKVPDRCSTPSVTHKGRRTWGLDNLDNRLVSTPRCRSRATTQGRLATVTCGPMRLSVSATSAWAPKRLLPGGGCPLPCPPENTTIQTAVQSSWLILTSSGQQEILTTPTPWHPQ